jgi:hypothetical protein
VPTAPLEESGESEKELPAPVEVDASIEGEAAPVVDEEVREATFEDGTLASWFFLKMEY